MGRAAGPTGDPERAPVAVLLSAAAPEASPPPAVGDALLLRKAFLDRLALADVIRAPDFVLSGARKVQ